MLYTFIKFIIKKSLAIHYRKIKGINLSAMPKSGPLIIAASHPNSFLDAVIVASLVNRPLYFLARGDVFTKPWAGFILQFLNLIPIYRLSEGTENLHKNQDTFGKCYEILENKGAILVFPEGTSMVDKEIHPLKKGIARIAFGFLEKHDFREKLSIVTVGINYDNPKKFGNNIFVGFGTPFTLNPWITQYKENHNKAFSEFNQYLYYGLQKQVIEVDKEDFDLFEALCQMDPSYKNQSLDRMILIAKNLKQLKIDAPNNYRKLKSNTLKTKGKLSNYGLEIKHLKHPVKISAFEIIINLILLPLSLFGFLFNTWPHFFGKKMANRLTEEYLQFTYSVNFAVATLSWLLFVIVLTVVFTISLGQWMLLITPVVLYWSLLAFKRLYKLLRKLYLVNRLNRLKFNEKEQYEIIEELKKTIRLRNDFELIPKD